MDYIKFVLFIQLPNYLSYFTFPDEPGVLVSDRIAVAGRWLRRENHLNLIRIIYTNHV